MTVFQEHRAVLIERSGRYYFHIEALGLLGSGEDVASAYEDLKRRREEYLTQARAADLLDELPRTRKGNSGSVGTSDLRGFLLRVGIVLGAVLLLLLPASWSIGALIDRTAVNMRLTGRHEFWAGVENTLHQLASAENELPAERRQRLEADLRTLVNRVRPFSEALWPLLPSPAAPGCAEPAKRHDASEPMR
ncbi:MAG: hypothetical protein ABT940_12995, partial [Alphaproteobacteria bacterium]